MADEGLRQAQRKMAAAGVHPMAIAVFAHYYGLVAGGGTGMIAEDDIEPVEALPRLADVDVDVATAREALARTAVVKLNGGLGTSMGMQHAKSLVEVRSGLRFIDLIVRQVRAVRAGHGVRLPLLFMDSFRTRDDTLAALSAYPDLTVDGLPLDFLQSFEPKLLADDLTPVEWPTEPALEWCPPGHGDLYPSLLTSEVLPRLRERGYRRLFVSNADNLGARPDPRLAGWFARSGSPFAAEYCRRTEMDRKGGHLARRRADGQLVLRESAQTNPADAGAFADIDRHRFFNTNNLWLDLDALASRLEQTGGVLGLPLIRNVKTVDPTDAASPTVVQIETAMGAAIGVFEGATAIEVDRSRFLPVKTTSDLLAIRSDAFELRDDGDVRLAARRSAAPIVDLNRHYRFIEDFVRRFPHGPPSLIDCDRLVVRGDWTFGDGVTVVGDVELPADDAPGRVPDGAVLRSGG
jgi:UTP--glucose-1-phosphate uridylyltransferase